MSGSYGLSHDTASIATIKRGFELVHNFLHTAGYYTVGHNEECSGRCPSGSLQGVLFIFNSFYNALAAKSEAANLLRNTLAGLNAEWVVSLNQNEVINFSGISAHKI